MLKPIRLTAYAVERCLARGATMGEVEAAIRSGTREDARYGRFLYKANFQYNAKWQGEFYRTKQVVPIVAEEEHEVVVVTVYTLFF